LLVFVATNDSSVNQAVVEAARANGRLVNVADNPANCDFTLPAVVRQGEINLAVSTGVNPALTAHLRQKIAEIIGPEYSKLTQLMGELRPEVKASLPPKLRPTFWKNLISSPILDFLRNGHDAEAHALAETLLLEAQRVSE
jgi:precorrin-2 dehydrogenase/sirohydrochlorin ferrochelatase